MSDTLPKSMKETTFEFELRLSDAGTEDCLNDLLSELQGLPGVKQIDVESDLPFATLMLRVAFPDKNAAVRLHRTAMKAIMKTAGVSISRVTTRLTDIFD